MSIRSYPLVFATTVSARSYRDRSVPRDRGTTGKNLKETRDVAGFQNKKTPPPLRLVENPLPARRTLAVAQKRFTGRPRRTSSR